MISCMGTQLGIWFPVSLALRGPHGPISSQALGREACTVLTLPYRTVMALGAPRRFVASFLDLGLG